MFTVGQYRAIDNTEGGLWELNRVFHLPPARASVDLASHADVLRSSRHGFVPFFFLHNDAGIGRAATGRSRRLCHDRRRATIPLCSRRCLGKCPSRLVYQSSLARRASQCKIGLFELASKQLKRNHIGPVDFFIHWVDEGFGRMFLAPNRSNHGARLPIQRHRGHGVSPGRLYRCDIKTERVAGTVCTAYVEVGVALQAADACAVVRLANLAHGIIPERWSANAFGHVEPISIAVFDFGVPERTIDVNPIVVGCSLEGGTGESWPSFFQLPEAVFFPGLLNKLFLQSLLLTFPIGFLLVGHLGWLEEIGLCRTLRT